MKRLLVCAAALTLAALPAQAAIARQAAPAAAPAEPSAHQRLLPLEGVQNARDIGGYRTADGRTVKWDVIYRTAELSHLTAHDKALLEARGLRSIHDLRSVDERRDQPTDWTGEGAPAITAFDYSMDMSGFAALFQGEVTADRAREVFAASYPELLKMQRPQQRALFADLLKGEGAVLYHCSAGKDRTGMATALILSALGVPRETILADYELSNQYYRPDLTTAEASDNPQAAAFMRLPEDVRAIFMGVDARYLQAVFDIIDRDYGSVEAYLDQELDVDAADIQRLRSLYTV
ncbi:tyrosine-protein phosphatase [Brevundimonas albigilva]|uniref:Tyrosine-protein phosphatase n=1 Tax=Brevundimonas albigilva TaxID=1312364 RepID=A0ABY4SI99_9CAUL|nr:MULTISPECIES: tyrosine-protein phosphatase [Brevundimonas]UQV17639.1 tyrosine-protein phosphatase [Brevundimonas albigilva]URI14498.1 tyrosine-protein phosphatase [Brevundimonas albigilva]